MANNYEMMYILRPDLSEEQVGNAIERYQTFISDRGAENIQIQNRGKRRLAYPIKKYLDGIYIQMNYQADGTQIAPLERSMRLEEEVIRYLTIKLKKPSVTVAETTEELETEEQTQPTEPEVAEA
ncbi:MAG: 30S ribosomal protein S6 [Xenococcaceae cyanobacterium MO_188.B32]|nr:30S ribosomal protein S6 [Xenococcaceae cyanobacterium MO_188.B32]